MNYTTLLGMQAVQMDGKKLGVCLGAVREGNAITKLVCCDDDESEFCVCFGDIVRMDERIVFKRIEKAQKGLNVLRLGASAFDERGKYLGTTREIIIKDNTITHAVIGKRKIAFNRVILGDITIVKDDLGENVHPNDLFLQAIFNG